jgi:two-component system sensor histidine kinase YesM
MFWYERSAEIIRFNAVQYGQRAIEQINDRLEASINELERITLPALTDPSVHAFLKESNDAHPYVLYQLRQKIENDVFFSMMSSDSDIQQLSVVSENGLAASTSGLESALNGFESYRQSKPSAESLMDFRGFRWIGSTPVHTITRDIIDPYTYRRIGMLIIDMKYSTLLEMLEKFRIGVSDVLWVADAEGRFIYHPDRRWWGREVADLYPDFRPTAESGVISNGGGSDSLMIVKRLTAADWILVDIVPMNELTGSLTTFRNFTMLIALILIILLMAILGGFSFSLIRNLLTLQKLMKKAEIGDLDVRAPHHDSREIGGLYRSFNTMVSEIKRLIEEVHLAQLREKEMELRHMQSRLMIMQSQINPHFLYNTLDVVNSYAIEAQVKPISRMISSIAKMFRYNMGNLQSVVTLDEELEHARTYLEIQKERYGALELRIDVDEALSRQVSAVRLVLQPIIENAFIHGYDQRHPKFLRIAAVPSGNHVAVRIIDRGRGMPRETMDRLNRSFSLTSIRQIMLEQHAEEQQGIGLWNVHCRLRMTFDEPYGLYINRSDAEGTEIEIRLPRRNRYV